jgi:hypothetical protein
MDSLLHAPSPPNQVRVYVDPLWLRQGEGEALSLGRALTCVPFARTYGTGMALLQNGAIVPTAHVGPASGYLSPRERTLARHRAIAGMISIPGTRMKMGGGFRPSSQSDGFPALAVHVPTWDWDCEGGDVSLFTVRLQSPRGALLARRLGRRSILNTEWIVDESALVASATEMVSLALEAASCEALALGKRAYVKLPPLGATPTLFASPSGLRIGASAHRCFWTGAKLALKRCSFPGIAAVEACDKFFNEKMLGEYDDREHEDRGASASGSMLQWVGQRDILDFSDVPDDLLRCIIIPGSSFQLPGGFRDFYACLESSIGATSDMSHFCAVRTPSVVENWVYAEQPAVARPFWWPPNPVRKFFSLSAAPREDSDAAHTHTQEHKQEQE